MILLAIDPGVRHPAGAIFRDRLLMRASRVALPSSLIKLEVGDRLSRIANLIVEWADSVLGTSGMVGELTCEMPQIYSASKSKGDPNNLVLLAVLDGMIEGRLKTVNRDLITRLPKPAEWCGQIPKNEDGDPWDSARGHRVRSRLSDTEFATVDASHDAIDAVGIGLWACGRFERRRVYPGAT